MSAYDQGRDACHYGMQECQNPYKRGSDNYESWKRGWHDEQQYRVQQRAKLLASV